MPFNNIEPSILGFVAKLRTTTVRITTTETSTSASLLPVTATSSVGHFDTTPQAL
jgi:hypothetical protein